MIKKTPRKTAAPKRDVKTTARQTAANKKPGERPVRTVMAPYKKSRLAGLKEAVAASKATLPAWFWTM